MAVAAAPDVLEKKQLLDSSSSASASASFKPRRNAILVPLLWTLIAPVVCLLLGILVDTHFLPLIVLFLIHVVKPVLYVVSRHRRLPAPLMRLVVVVHDDMETTSTTTTTTTTAVDDQQHPQQQQQHPPPLFLQSVLEDMVAHTLRTHRSMAVQLTVLMGFLIVYHATEQNCGKNVHQAYQNAVSIISWEHAVNMDVEPSMQQWMLSRSHHHHTTTSGWMSKCFDQYYAIMHFTVTAWTAGWIVAAAKDPHYQHRASFGFTLVLALLGYWSFPTMPPRLLSQYRNEYLVDNNNNNTITTSTDDTNMMMMMSPWYDMVDTLRVGQTTYDKLMEMHGNPYAAMPSMHTGWALWSALVVYDCTGYKVLFGHVVLIMFATIVSANHYILDLVAGIVCTLVGRYVAARVVNLWLNRKRRKIRRQSDDDGNDDKRRNNNDPEENVELMKMFLKTSSSSSLQLLQERSGNNSTVSLSSSSSFSAAARPMLETV